MVSMYPPKKNTAFIAIFPILDADGDPVSGATGLDSEISKDGGAYADCTNEATEIGTSGTYSLSLTAAEMNADYVMIIVKTTTSGAKTTVLTYYTVAATIDDIYALIDTEIAAIKAKTDLIGASVALETGGNLAAVKAKTDNLPSDPADESLLEAAISSVPANVWGYATRTLTSFGTLVADIWGYTTRTLTAFGSSLAQEIWDKLTSALTTAGSIGKLLVDNVNATISSRAPESGGNVAAIKTKTDSLAFTAGNVHAHVKVKDNLDFGALEKASIETACDASLDNAIPGSPTAGSVNDFLTKVKKVLWNRWKMESNQQKVYDDDKVAVIRTFNLKDSAGDPAMENVYERDPA